jgi:DNA integrity scanning protein DisA with diadenylate cyclase activity
MPTNVELARQVEELNEALDKIDQTLATFEGYEQQLDSLADRMTALEERLVAIRAVLQGAINVELP